MRDYIPRDEARRIEWMSNFAAFLTAHGASYGFTSAEIATFTAVAADAATAFTVISEQGPDMSRFPTVKHFCSHMGLCPGNKVSGGKRLGGRTRKVQSRAAKALRVAA